jgi:glycosyltransferase involved in cell wall biosynthesis
MNDANHAEPVESGSGRAQVLFVAAVSPWPATDGYRLRTANLIESLRRLGDVDLLFLGPAADRPDPALVPDGITVRQLPAGRPARGKRLRTWLTTDQPRALGWLEPTAPLSSAGLRSRYDLVVCSHLHTWLTVGRHISAPCIVDYDNLFIRAGAEARPHELVPLAKWLVKLPADLLDERRMRRQELACAAAVEAVLLCSELDRTRLGAPNGVVVPNGYELTWPPPGPNPVTDAPNFGFVGLLDYPPNTDAVRWFAAEVLGRIRAEIPAARFRVVGRRPEAVADVGQIDGVDLVGSVDDLRDELVRTDVSVCPIRFGGGTRLKVVEGLANRLPMVSTTKGCEGIDVHHDEHLLIADDPAAFAAACVRLARDEPLRQRLSHAGAECFTDRYQWSTIGAAFAAFAGSIVQRTG